MIKKVRGMIEKIEIIRCLEFNGLLTFYKSNPMHEELMLKASCPRGLTIKEFVSYQKEGLNQDEIRVIAKKKVKAHNKLMSFL